MKIFLLFKLVWREFKTVSTKLKMSIFIYNHGTGIATALNYIKNNQNF